MSKNLQDHAAAMTRHFHLQRQRNRLSSFVLSLVAAILLPLWLGVVPASSAMAAPAA